MKRVRHLWVRFVTWMVRRELARQQRLRERRTNLRAGVETSSPRPRWVR